MEARKRFKKAVIANKNKAVIWKVQIGIKNNKPFFQYQFEHNIIYGDENELKLFPVNKKLVSIQEISNGWIDKFKKFK